MKSEEKLAKLHLEHIGCMSILYEPDGNIPPDFLVNGEIAVEVRRLNQHFKNGDAVEPLENLEFKLIPRVVNLMKQYEHIHTSHSVYVFVNFERPLKSSKEIFKKIKHALDSHLSNIEQTKKVKINEKLSLSFHPASKRHKSVFLLGGSSDGDSGGFVVANVYDHIPLMVKDKENKVRPYFSKYKTWWLLLVDTIGYGLGDYDLQQLNSNPPIRTIFDKIILVSPLDQTIGNEIKIEKLYFSEIK